MQSSRRAGQAFGINGGVKTSRIIIYCISAVSLSTPLSCNVKFLLNVLDLDIWVLVDLETLPLVVAFARASSLITMVLFVVSGRDVWVLYVVYRSIDIYRVVLLILYIQWTFSFANPTLFKAI